MASPPTRESRALPAPRDMGYTTVAGAFAASIISESWSSWEGSRHGFAGDLGADARPSLGLYIQYSGYTFGRHPHRFRDFLRREGQRRTKEQRRNTADHAFAAAAFEYLFADCQAAGTERGKYQNRIHYQERAPAPSGTVSRRRPGWRRWWRV